MKEVVMAGLLNQLHHNSLLNIYKQFEQPVMEYGLHLCKPTKSQMKARSLVKKNIAPNQESREYNI